MTSKCANPACLHPFHYLGEGKLFRMETPAEGPERGEAPPFSVMRPRRVEHFWLCGDCARTLTLIQEEGQVLAVPISRASRMAAA